MRCVLGLLNILLSCFKYGRVTDSTVVIIVIIIIIMNDGRGSCLWFESLLTRRSCLLSACGRNTTVVSPVSDAIDTTVVSIAHLWTIHDGRVRRVKYKGHDRRVRNIHLFSVVLEEQN